MKHDYLIASSHHRYCGCNIDSHHRMTFLSNRSSLFALYPRHSSLPSRFLPRAQHAIPAAARYRRDVSETLVAAPEVTRGPSRAQMDECLGYLLLARPHRPPPRSSTSWACLGVPRQNEEEEGKWPRRRERQICCRRSKLLRGGEGVPFVFPRLFVGSQLVCARTASTVAISRSVGSYQHNIL